MEKSVGLFAIRTEIKRLADDGRARNALIAASRGPERHAARQAKRGVGETARAFLLAYAMARGIPYHVLERATRTPAWQLGGLRHEVSEIVREHIQGRTGDEVEAWFDAEVSP